MGILDRFKRQATPPGPEQPVSDEAEPATESLIPERDVRKTARWSKFDAEEHERRNIPEELEVQAGPLGAEKPYSIVTEGFHKYVKNKRPGTEIELTLKIRWVPLFKGAPGDSPILDVFHEEQQIGTVEMQRGGWFVPAVELAEKHSVVVKASGVMAIWGERREPFIYLPDPQKFYDYLRRELQAQVSQEAHNAH